VVPKIFNIQFYFIFGWDKNPKFSIGKEKEKGKHADLKTFHSFPFESSGGSAIIHPTHPTLIPIAYCHL